ncbi:hypothetical protein LQ327_12575 [Actinomycetospora endophytica]|uniref:Secreted protein n=1 Tax=Actinomycetospora endophytica TaxID=2291215 RepID=A0ABS8P9K6_9PSEU|nr:hypothetical protein [Actinomycetospora endophytica]MCD2194210.1 hypothetical protein [Actinomycetospora endophytica]
MASRNGPRRRVRWARAAAVVVLTLGAVTLPGGAAWAIAGSESWAAELSVGGGDDANVVARDGAIRLASTTPRTTSTGPAAAEGELLLPPRRVAAVTDRVAADATTARPAGSDVVVAVRGLRSDGSWSQWTTATATAPALLPEATLEVQVRVTLVAGAGGASPSLSRLWLTADRAPASSTPPATTDALTARVFATRVGLVGNRTANGHRVVSNDRFVALPSRRGLAPDGAGDYTVQVCTDAGRCAWAPVWDLGPWNTRDDYWSTPGTRESFGDLPRGVPEAQAAATDGYAGGHDGSGRKVTNPAGIDLADGTFSADLGLRDNSWVQATYLWTGTGRSGTASGDAPVTVRASAAADGRDVGVISPHARVPVQCLTSVQAVAGRAATNPGGWLRIGPERYVPADALEVSDVPAC